MDLMQHGLLAGVGSLVAVAVASGVAEYRRKHRRTRYFQPRPIWPSARIYKSRLCHIHIADSGASPIRR